MQSQSSADQPAPRNCYQHPRGLTNGRGELLQASAALASPPRRLHPPRFLTSNNLAFLSRHTPRCAAWQGRYAVLSAVVQVLNMFDQGFCPLTPGDTIQAELLRFIVVIGVWTGLSAGPGALAGGFSAGVQANLCSWDQPADCSRHSGETLLDGYGRGQVHGVILEQSTGLPTASEILAGADLIAGGSPPAMQPGIKLTPWVQQGLCSM
jgi:hypothetical protein